MPETELGVITHFFDRIGVGAIKVTQGTLNVGNTVHIKGAHTDVTVTINSMQVEHNAVTSAKAGDEVGVKFDQKLRVNDKVFLVTP